MTMITPDVPPDPEVDSYLGQLRIHYKGTAPVDVHVGAAEDFTACHDTLVDALQTAGITFVSAPVGEDRYVRFIDHRHGGQSRTVCGSVSPCIQITADGGFWPGRLTTALTGARREVGPPADLAEAFERWAGQASAEAIHALDADEVGEAARLRGKAEGLTLAAAELRRAETRTA